MLCTYCGADTPPALDRCVVCQTPYPPGFAEGATIGATDVDADQTRLAKAGETVAPATGASIPNVGGVPVLQTGQTFANRYTIIRLLGAGGMAAVYQAWDETLATAVALKLIRVDPTMQPEDIRQLEERFKRELKLARQVTHPNVVRIHDLGEVGRTLYLTMAYVQGSDLSTVLQREGKLPIARLLALARQIVSGLGAAHKAGVVHRDLKPANIMVDAEDHALLMDFGIARSTGGDQALMPDVAIAHTRTNMSLHTMPGAIMGTLEYMAPEQARGEPVDQRTDIYAVGLILYELISGVRPRSGQGGFAELLARLQKGPPPLREAAPDVPDAVDAIVAKCLKLDAAERYATCDDLLADLEGLDSEGKPIPAPKRIPRWKVLSAAAVLGALLVTGTWWLAASRVPPAAKPPLPVLIVDFENKSQDTAFEGALEQALGIAMEEAPFVTAYPRRDAARLVSELKLGDKLDAKAGMLVANREGIPVILAGSIEPNRGGYRITVRAVNPDKPEPPLAEATETAPDKSSVLAAVSRAAVDIRTDLGDTTPSSAQQAETFTAASLDAIREYTIAQDLSANQKDEEAIAHYDRAIGYDREFGRAYAGRAMSLHYLGRRKDAEDSWKQALNRIDRMSEREKLRTTGSYLAGPARNYAQAIDEYTTLVTKYPADSAGHNNLAVAYFSTLNFAKALEHGQRAIKIYPRSFKYRVNYALYAMYAGDFVLAAATAQELIKEDPKFDTAYLPLAMEALASRDVDRARTAYAQAAIGSAAGASLGAIGIADIDMFQGKNADAIAALPASVKRDGDERNTVGAVAKLLALADAYAASNRWPQAHRTLEEARKLSQDDSVLVTTARLSIASGRIDQAKTIAGELAQRTPVQSRAYGKMIEAEVAMAAKQFPAAIDALTAARDFADLWLVRYTSGLVYFNRGDYLEAVSEFAKCQERRGEVTALFLDDLPTFRYYALVPYWLGRAREMQGLDAKPQYEEFLAIRGGAANDPLVVDVRRRLNPSRP
jgi:eukaryotic-like serine/threonine-protein kinase